ncbi:MAG TPA: type II toxin-antitoxin system HicB family antitoxin [Geminicoccaceae bacterium]|jgi:antitoxin HicB|nr:type II toxin-antitoxin system HicB family antitoxin [Geminicoccaceae bacterium]
MSGATEYAVLIEPLSAADGGGWVAVVPDLPGCMSDGETMAEALENALGAIESWKEAAEESGRPIPAPHSSLGQWRQRVPKTLHATLKRMAETEGVSLNMLVAAILAESVGKRLGSQHRNDC